MIDLHAHTNISDGTFTPAQLVQEAHRIGLSAIAITDHDSIIGHEEAQLEADRLGIRLVKGIEFSVVYGENRLIHILGLGIEPNCPGFMDRYTKCWEEKSGNLSTVFEYLKDQGIDISPLDVEPYVVGGYMDRQAIVKCMVVKGFTQNLHTAWRDYMEKIPYFPGELITPKDAFDAIHAAGGKAFMAHYHLSIGLKGYSDEEARRRLAELKALGLDGLEYYYPSFTEEDTRKCAQYIEEFGFLKSGGSDFHGSNREHIKLGTGEGDFSVPDELLKNIF